MVHQAKVDRWLAVVFGGVLLLEVVIGTALIVSGLLPYVLIPLAAGIFVSLILWGAYHTTYEVTASDLIIRFGPCRRTVPVDRILAVVPTREATNAPAPSLDRLRIEYRAADGLPSFVLISSNDKEAFLRDLARVAPQVQAPI
jgi:hypothetical protein